MTTAVILSGGFIVVILCSRIVRHLLIHGILHVIALFYDHRPEGVTLIIAMIAWAFVFAVLAFVSVGIYSVF